MRPTVVDIADGRPGLHPVIAWGFVHVSKAPVTQDGDHAATMAT